MKKASRGWRRNERNGEVSGDRGLADCSSGSFAMVGYRKGMAGKIARRHQLLERQFQFPFSNRHLFDCQRRFDAAALVVQEIKITKHTKYTKSLPFVYLGVFRGYTI